MGAFGLTRAAYRRCAVAPRSVSFSAYIRREFVGRLTLLLRMLQASQRVSSNDRLGFDPRFTYFVFPQQMTNDTALQ